MAERAGLFDDSDDFDVSDFTPKKPVKAEAPPPQAVRAIAESANFPSRDPGKPAAVKQRRRRTGRNIQLNTKVTMTTRDAFYEISDRYNWVLGETLERALAALKRELGLENANPPR